jgi:hypothetical protein
LGYNFRIMLKWLAIALFAALIITVVLVARYDEIHDTEGKGYEVKCVQSNDPSMPVPSLVCTVEHGQKTKSGEYQPVWWHVFFTWPEGITALLILLTLVAISLQTWQTRKAAIATAEAANASRDSLKIQEAAFIQWVEMVDWKIYSEFANEEIDKPRTVEIRVHFAIANKTPRPLTIRSVSTRIQFQNWQTERVFTVNESSKIPPRGKYGVGIAITLEHPQLDLWWTNNLLGTCRVDVSYENALGIKDEWSYPFVTKCGRSGSFLLTAFYSATEKS